MAGLAAYLAGAAASLAGFGNPRRARLGGFGLAVAGALLELLAAAIAIGRGSVTAWSLPCGIDLFSWTIRLNALSAYFNLALGTLAVAASIYSMGYLRPWEGRRNIAGLGFFYNVMLLSLTLVFAAGDAFFFLVAWEMMAVSAYFLVSYEHEKAETRRAGMLFLIMSHTGTGLLLIAFLMLAKASGSLSFARFHQIASTLPAWEQGAVLLLFFSGFGVQDR